MLVTRADSGALHSRAMAPVSTEGFNFTFIANNESGKFDELTHDGAVNISYFEPSSTNWLSVSGTGKVVEDKEQIKKVWSPMIKVRPRNRWLDCEIEQGL